MFLERYFIEDIHNFCSNSDEECINLFLETLKKTNKKNIRNIFKLGTLKPLLIYKFFKVGQWKFHFPKYNKYFHSIVFFYFSSWEKHEARKFEFFKYQNFFNLGARKILFLKYKKFFGLDLFLFFQSLWQKHFCRYGWMNCLRFV